MKKKNYQLNEEKNILELRRKNRELERQIERMKAGKSAKPFISKFGLLSFIGFGIFAAIAFIVSARFGEALGLVMAKYMQS